MSKRTFKIEWGPGKPRKRTSAANWALPLKWNREAIAEGVRKRVFCASLADVFDNEVDPQWRVDLLALIAVTPHLDWLLLTKRIGNVNAMLIEAKLLSTNWDGVDVKNIPCPSPAFDMLLGWLGGRPPANIWIGATTCNQAEADRDIPKLLDVPAAKRFLSIEPMLGRIEIGFALPWQLADSRYKNSIDWVIVGGESSPGARPMKPNWVRRIRDECTNAGVAFLFKQWGEFDVDGVRVGKKTAGRILDGAEYNAVPLSS